MTRGMTTGGARRLGHDRRLVVGRQPDHRLPRDRSRRSTPSASRCSATRVSARPCCGHRRRTSASRPSSRAARAKWAPRWRAATGARRSTTWRRTSHGSSRRRSQQWAGRWNDMPVDAHMLIALSAPRPVFITGGTTDQWADPVGMFKAAVAAGPVYQAAREEGSRHHRAAAARHAADERRPRLALSHGRAHGDAGRLEGVPGVPREVFRLASTHSTQPPTRTLQEVRNQGIKSSIGFFLQTESSIS